MIDYFHLNMDAEQLLNLSSLGLAHLGDGVYELMVRSWLCLHGKATARNLHRATVGYVAAPAQARRAERILSLLLGQAVMHFRPMGRDRLRLPPPGSAEAESFYRDYGFAPAPDGSWEKDIGYDPEFLGGDAGSF